jgi:hypothetical protein
MKKLLFILLVVAFVGAMAFADGPTMKLSGYVGAGIKVSSDGTDTTVTMYDQNKDSGSNGVYASLAGTLDGGTYGLKWGFHSVDVSKGFLTAVDTLTGAFTAASATVTSGTYTPFVTFDDTLGWVYLANKMVKISMGKIDNGNYATYEAGDGSWDGNIGASVDIMPISGLSIGYFLPYNDTSTKVSDAFAESQFGAKFEMAKLFGVKVMYNLGTVDTSGNSMKDGELFASLNVTAIPNLTLQADFELPSTSSDNYKADGIATKLVQKVGYALGTITPSVVGTESLYKDYSTIAINPAVSVSVGGLSPSVSFTYTLSSDTNYAANTWNINPSVSVPVASNTVLFGANVNGSDASGAKTTWNVYSTFEMNF